MKNVLNQYKDHVNLLSKRYAKSIDSEVPNIHIYANYLNEREAMRIRREDRGSSPPWSNDPVLQHFRFTNIYREDDKVSRELVKSCATTKASIVMFNAVKFRTFNCQSGFDASGGFVSEWDAADAKAKADAAEKDGCTMFGNAYLMVNSMTTGRIKHQFYVENLFPLIWDDRIKIVKEIRDVNCIEGTMEVFLRYPGYGEFLAYELALDMEMMGVLRNPTDKFTWANPGPGARRGMNQVRGREINHSQPTRVFLSEMRDLFERSSGFLKKHITEDPRFPFDMRCIENGLCETGKYFSVLRKNSAKRRYHARG